MNKILIPLIILVSLYLAYNWFQTDEVISDETAIELSDSKKQERIIHNYDPEPEVPDVDVNPLLGKYVANVDNDNVSAEINVELLPNNRIVHYRYVNRDGMISEATVEGQYVVNGDRLEFTFPEERNKEVFKMPMLILSVAEDNTISSGIVKFVKA
ncbi:MAG: hypothetical protein ABJK37_15770 [Paraglaciecola sp.]|uniref:hypothetical protein n=1 Tax=Paraglaciecola sp. TaxID=1920173 RepID=UPI003298D35B